MTGNSNPHGSFSLPRRATHMVYGGYRARYLGRVPTPCVANKTKYSGVTTRGSAAQPNSLKAHAVELMSVDLNVFITRSQMPTPSQWAHAIRDAGFDVQLDTDFNVDTFMGFLPCKYKNIDAGFEYYSRTLADEERAEIGVAKCCNYSVTFVTGSDMHEFITSLVSAGVLCKISGGTFFDPQSGDAYSADQILDWVRAQVQECETHL